MNWAQAAQIKVPLCRWNRCGDRRGGAKGVLRALPYLESIGITQPDAE
jgi:hypothetical protein